MKISKQNLVCKISAAFERSREYAETFKKSDNPQNTALYHTHVGMMNAYSAVLSAIRTGNTVLLDI